jgi:L-threonylcarbamoyladenylate synthase
MKLSILVEKCGKVLERGGLAVLPTDTVYGLAARADNPEAVDRVFEVKGRGAEKALVVMVSIPEEAAELAAPEERESLIGIGSLWPGPLTMVVKAGDISWRKYVAPSSATLGIRVPDSPFLLRLLGLTGPLAVTSANPAGGKVPGSFREVDAELLAKVDLAVDGGYYGSGRPSTVAELSGDGVKVLRSGEIGEAEIYRALRGG